MVATDYAWLVSTKFGNIIGTFPYLCMYHMQIIVTSDRLDDAR